LKPALELVNHIDFGVWKSTVEALEGFFEPDFQPDIFAGRGFAGSDQVSLVYKAPYQVAEGYKPLNKPYAEQVEVGTVFHKTGRTSCLTKAALINQSVYEIVGYGPFYIVFDDVYMTDKMLDPGDSGSSCWILEV